MHPSSPKAFCVSLAWIASAMLVVLASCPAWAFETSHVMGDAAENLMDDYFKGSGWTSVRGQNGRQGIDGLFVKMENGVVKDVLVVESKYNSSKLGKNLVCGGNQMSHDWTQCKLNDLLKSSTDPEEQKMYQQIQNHVSNRNYRSRIWRTKVVDGKLRIDVEGVGSKGDDVSTSELSGREKYKVQTREIDLKNPKDDYERKMADKFYANLDKSLEKNGLSAQERATLLDRIKKNPAKFDEYVHHAARGVGRPKVTAGASTAKKFTQAGATAAKSGVKGMAKATKNVAKGFMKSLGRNLKTGLTGATAGAAGGPLGAVIGFVGGVAVGMATDYLVDTAVDTAFAAATGESGEPQDGGQVAQPAGASVDEVRGVVEESARQTQESIAAVQSRMEEEFSILGEDLQNKHDAEMSAINANMVEIIKGQELTLNVSNQVSGLRTEVLGGFQALGQQLTDISSTLNSVSARIDLLLDKVDASLKAKYDNGVQALDDFEDTGDIARLNHALECFQDFTNTFERMHTRTAEEDELLLMGRHYLATVYAELYAKTKNAGYAQGAIQGFGIIQESSASLELLIMTYVVIQDCDTNGTVAAALADRNTQIVLGQLESGSLNQAQAQAAMLASLIPTHTAETLRTAVTAYVEKGQAAPELRAVADADYVALMRHVHGETVDPAEIERDYVRAIVTRTARPSDFMLALDRFQSAELTKFAVRELTKGQYYEPALRILNEYAVNNDTFRAKTYLLLLKETDTAKYEQFRELVRNNATYSQEAKNFIKDVES